MSLVHAEAEDIDNNFDITFNHNGKTFETRAVSYLHYHCSCQIFPPKESWGLGYPSKQAFSQWRPLVIGVNVEDFVGDEVLRFVPFGLLSQQVRLLHLEVFRCGSADGVRCNQLTWCRKLPWIKQGFKTLPSNSRATYSNSSGLSDRQNGRRVKDLG